MRSTYILSLRLLTIAVVVIVLSLAVFASSDGEEQPWEVLHTETR